MKNIKLVFCTLLLYENTQLHCITPRITRTNQTGLSTEDRRLLNAQKQYFEFLADHADLIKDFIKTLERTERQDKTFNEHNFKTEFFEGIKLLLPALLDFKDNVLPTIEQAVTVKKKMRQ